MAISDLKTAPRTRKGPTCTVCAALESLPDTEAAALRSLLSDPEWRYQAIADAVRKDPDHPLDIAAHTYANHARGHCAGRDKLR